VDSRAVGLAYKTLTSAFPYVETWITGAGDLLLIGHSSPPAYSLEHLRQRVSVAPFAEAIERVWLTKSVEGLLAHHFASPVLAAHIAQTIPAPNTDNRNQLEYGFARALAERGSFNPGELLSQASALNADLPAHLAGDVDHHRVQMERLLMWASQNVGTKQMPGIEGDDRRRADAILAFVEKRYHDTLSSWVGPSMSVMAQLLLLESAAAAGLPDPALLEQVSRNWPADARFAEAESAWRHSSPVAAVNSLREAFTELRKQIWSRPQAVEKGLALAAQVANGSPERAQLFLELLREPFPGGLAETNRMRALAEIGANMAPRRQATVAAMFEPYPVWTRPFLQFRASAYRAASDVRAAKAAADLRDFDRHADRNE
jgi:hypothetical protein